MHRSHNRYRVAACADVAGADLLLYHPIHDISEGGMCYAAATPGSPGSALDVVLTFPRTRTEIPVRGQVVWVDDDECEQRVGVRWVELSPAERRALSEHIAASKTAVASPGDLH